MKFRFLFLAIAILMCGTSALIADKTHAANAADACRADLERYCPNIEPGPRLGECMEQHQNELSSDCKKAHEQIKASGRVEVPAIPAVRIYKSTVRIWSPDPGSVNASNNI